MAKGQPANEPKTQLRATKTKVRSGCVTCRLRRVKCDEGKPGCLRCEKYGHPCGGYKSPFVVVEVVSKPSRQLLPKSGLQMTSYPSSLYLDKTAVENRYFRYFKDSTVPDLAGSFDVALWNIIVLQACHQETYIWHAVVAIGALDKSLQVSTVSKSSDAANRPDEAISKMHRGFALLEYSKALKAMRDTTWDIEANPRNALIVCLLVVCVENFLDNRHGALAHAQAGYRILRDWLNSHPHLLPHESGISSPASRTVEDDLVLAFGKLDMQVSSIYDTRPFQEHLALKMDSNTIIKHIPAKFTELKQAKVFLDVIMRRVYHFMSSALIMSDAQALSKPFEIIPPTEISVCNGTNIHSTTNIISNELRIEQALYEQEILRWSQAFQPLLCALKQTIDPTTRIAFSVLQIHYLATKVMLASIIFESEMCYDQFEPDFREIIDLIKSGTHLSGKDISTWDRGISLEHGLASPLFLIATRCRHRTLRREAISILQSLPNEGAWEPELVAIIALWIIEVEEEGVLSDIIPEASRAIISRISEIPKGHVALFQCVQRQGGPDGGPIWKEKMVTW